MTAWGFTVEPYLWLAAGLLLIVAAVLTLWSGYLYFADFFAGHRAAGAAPESEA